MIKAGLRGTPPGIVLDGSTRHGARVLFQRLSFEALGGQWTCLLGPSGVGKTTILRLFAGLETGATFDGEIAASDGMSLVGRISYMAQQDLLMPWLNIEDNVLLGARLRGQVPDRDRARGLIQRVGLDADTHKRPKELSGGMRQRVALARTLMEDRPVVLLDEPFSALDAHTRAEMQELSAELLAGRTVLLVTHDPGEAARLGHQINMMTENGLRSVDTPPGEPVRAYDDPAVFACQSALMNLVRSAA